MNHPNTLPGLNLIGGRHVAGEGRETHKLYNPADTNDLIAAVREASAEQSKRKGDTDAVWTP